MLSHGPCSTLRDGAGRWPPIITEKPHDTKTFMKIYPVLGCVSWAHNHLTHSDSSGFLKSCSNRRKEILATKSFGTVQIPDSWLSFRWRALQNVSWRPAGHTIAEKNTLRRCAKGPDRRTSLHHRDHTVMPWTFEHHSRWCATEASMCVMWTG